MGKKEMEAEAKIDYFATSLPLLLVFDDNLELTQKDHAKNLIELAQDGMRQLNNEGRDK